MSKLQSRLSGGHWSGVVDDLDHPAFRDRRWLIGAALSTRCSEDSPRLVPRRAAQQRLPSRARQGVGTLIFAS